MSVLSRLAMLGLLGATAACGQPEPLRFGVQVEDAGQLGEGSPVVFRDVEIGRVSSVRQKQGEAVIRVEIAPQHREQLYREVQFSIGDYHGQPCLWVDDLGSERTAIQDGEVLDARPGWFQRLSRRLEELGGSARQALSDAKSELTDTVEAFEKSREFQAFKERMAEAGKDVAALARRRYGRFVEEDLPKLEARARAYRDKLEREGKKTEAEIFWKWFQRWADSVKSTQPEAEPEPLRPEKEPRE